jgi:uracil-DNA glycosylase family 4
VVEVRPGVVTASTPRIPRNERGTPDRRRAAGYSHVVGSAEQRREELKAVWQQASACTKCPQLAAARRTVVFGAGNADADLMFVGEAPGAREDETGLPFVGQAGRLLERLLGEIGLQRADVFICNTLKCRPPGNRDPLPQEIEACQDYLFRQLELIEPRVVCTLGNFATKLLRGDPGTGITRLHGREEVRRIGPRTVRLYPIYHPAAALYTPAMLDTLRADFARIPELLALEPPPQPEPAEAEPVVPEPELVRAVEEQGPEPEPEREPEREPAEAQLGLF